jgi:putative ATP-binding cassette transporter
MSAVNFMSAIEGRHSAGFVHYAWLYVAVFAGSTLAAVFFRFTEDRPGLLWRDWFTHRITGLYFDRRIYLNMTGGGRRHQSNPDHSVLELAAASGITCIVFGGRQPNSSHQGASLEFHDVGSWTWQDA